MAKYRAQSPHNQRLKMLPRHNRSLGRGSNDDDLLVESAEYRKHCNVIKFIIIKLIEKRQCAGVCSECKLRHK